MATSIKARLTLVFVAILAAILGVFAASLYVSVRQELMRDLETRLAENARALADAVFEPAAQADLEGRIRAALAASDARAVVYDPQRREVFRSADLPAGRLGFEEVRAGAGAGIAAGPEGRPYRFTALRAVERGGGEYWIAYGLDEGPVRARLRRLLVFFAVFVPAVLAVSSTVGWLFVGGALAPVETLRRQAERISRSNLSERVPLPEAQGELRELAATFNGMLERLERAFEQMQTFTSNASHELKTPLANLRGEIELALQRGGAPADAPELLASIGEEVARMTRVVENMLLLAQLDSKQAPLKKEPVDVSALAAEIAEDARAMGEARRVEVKPAWVAPGVSVVGDEAALRRVMMNLLENAIKYNREGGQVKLSVWREDGTARIEVADDGPGIPPEHVPHLFERFHRVDATRGKGTGLGLSICKLLVEAHGGRIEVQSRVGAGTTFHVVLPARA